VVIHKIEAVAKTVSAVLAVLMCVCVDAAELKPFTSDGCSAFPDGTVAQNQLWLRCCVAHDLAYWQGGSWQQRLDADEALRLCVENVGEAEIAILMLAGVRVGGSPLLPTEFRWGYGWPYPKPYGVLSAEEQDQIKEAILRAEKQIQSFID
jgi:hypothetical protein